MDPAALPDLARPCAVALIGLAVLGAGAAVLFERRTLARLRSRLAGGAQPAAMLTPADLGPRLVEGLKKIGDRVVRHDPQQVSALRTQLALAGFMGREAVPIYLGARMAALAAAVGGSAMLTPWAVHGGDLRPAAAAGVLTLAAMLGPDQYVARRRSKLLDEYRDGFPDLLDLLVASVEAGLSLDAAVSRVAEELVRRHPNLAQQIRLLTNELRAGRARRDAWTSFADRLGLEEAVSLATMLRQAEEMGASLGDTLRVFSDEMRSKRMLRAEEKAAALPAKLMVPLILFIFPCLLGVLILPAAFKVAKAMGH
jgi:tight adherence protein C